MNSLFKKKKGKSKALDLKAVTAPKKQTKTKAEKQKEAAEDEEWKTETKKAVVLTNGKTVEEFGKVLCGVNGILLWITRNCIYFNVQ